MTKKVSELAGINLALERQQKVLERLEKLLFLEQLQLASLKAARERALRQSILSFSKDASILAKEQPR